MANSPKLIRKDKGFTLLELMITVAIIAIIASIAIPSYIDYTTKTHYSELVRATAPYKLGIVACYNHTGSFDNCNSGPKLNYDIPPSITEPPNPSSAIHSISVTKGVITAVPNPVNGIAKDQVYILTPSATNALISWSASGKGVEDGLSE
jgi:type IV pilus assembly protein PilA